MKQSPLCNYPDELGDGRRSGAAESTLILNCEKLPPHFKMWYHFLEIFVELGELSGTSLRDACQCVDQ